MKRIVISWIAWYNDFEGSEANLQGPNFGLHDNAWDEHGFDLHLLLAPAEEGDLLSAILFTTLVQKFPHHPIELIHVPMDDILDFQEIKTKVAKVLFPHREEELNFVINTGTTPMRTVWILLHLESNGLHTRLFQGIDATMGGSRGAHFRKLNLDDNIFVGSLLARYEDQQPAVSSQLITESFLSVYDEAGEVAWADPVPVLIEGPSGSGKEHLAQTIHAQSPRKRKPYLPVNCAALDEQLLESRLFGYKEGAFTGAKKDQKGFFEGANKGVIFLDEIGDISPRLQQSLLRVLQTGDILPVGAIEPVKVDVRIVAATNKNLWKLCEQGKFRWDLYYRLSIVELRLPAFADLPLDERRAFLNHFIKAKRRIGRSGRLLELSPEAESRIMSHSFPGNIRELENLITGLYVLSRGKKVTTELLDRIQRRRPERWPLTLAEVEARHIAHVYAACDQNVSRTARQLGIAINTLKSKIDKYGLAAPSVEE